MIRFRLGVSSYPNRHIEADPAVGITEMDIDNKLSGSEEGSYRAPKRLISQ